MAKRENGKSWFDVIFASAALVVSGVSLWVAIGTEDANRKMVAAAIWPILQISDSNASLDASKRELRFTILNSGVGPAKIASFELFWKGHTVSSSTELLKLCCDYQRPALSLGETSPVITSTVPQTVLRAGETRDFLTFALNDTTHAAWEKLDAARREGAITYRACYCSVFDECWTNGFDNVDALTPRAAKVCRAPAVQYRN